MDTIELRDFTRGLKASLDPHGNLLGIPNVELVSLLDELAKLRSAQESIRPNHSILAMVERYLTGTGVGTRIGFEVSQDTDRYGGKPFLSVVAQRKHLDGQVAEDETRVILDDLERMGREQAEDRVSQAVHLSALRIHGVGR